MKVEIILEVRHIPHRTVVYKPNGQKPYTLIKEDIVVLMPEDVDQNRVRVKIPGGGGFLFACEVQGSGIINTVSATTKLKVKGGVREIRDILSRLLGDRS